VLCKHSSSGIQFGIAFRGSGFRLYNFLSGASKFWSWQRSYTVLTFGATRTAVIGDRNLGTFFWVFDPSKLSSEAQEYTCNFVAYGFVPSRVISYKTNTQTRDFHMNIRYNFILSRLTSPSGSDILFRTFFLITLNKCITKDRSVRVLD
jgi:hypothetical protein